MHDCIGIQQLVFFLGAKCGVTFVFITESQNNGDRTAINRPLSVGTFWANDNTFYIFSFLQ